MLLLQLGAGGMAVTGPLLFLGPRRVFLKQLINLIRNTCKSQGNKGPQKRCWANLMHSINRPITERLASTTSNAS